MNHDDRELNIKSGHHKPPVGLWLVWAAFFVFLFIYLIRNAWPDLQTWLAK